MTRLLALPVALAVPPLLALLNVTLALTPVWLTAVYTRPGFPQDPYGFTTAERIELATRITVWLGSAGDAPALADLRFADGAPLLNERELRHMHDVRQLAGDALRIALLAVLSCIPAILHRQRGSILKAALFRGGLLTLGLLATLIVLAVANWDLLFTGFHRLFFERGTWQFAYSDTLIRLFPEQFWLDALLFIVGLTALQALLLVWLTSGSSAIPGLRPRLLYWLPRRAGATKQ